MNTSNQNIRLILNACLEGKEAGQKKLYELFFSYGMSIAIRYSSNREEAEEILNDAFIKVFAKIDQYDESYDFKKWFRQILINTAISHYRRYKKMIVNLTNEFHFDEGDSNAGLENLMYEDLLKLIQQLPPSYRLAVNMYAVDGLKHREIAEKLDISIGTSKSNYAKGRRLLISYLKKTNLQSKTHYGK